MTDLNSFIFTEDSDIAETLDDAIFNDTLVQTLKGDDLIKNSRQSNSNLDFGIFNASSGTIEMGQGNDSLTGSGKNGIINKGKIYMEDGNDSLRGGGSKGILNEGSIYLGDGNDSLSGSGSEGIINNGVISTDNGDDFLGGGGYTGMINNGIIRTGDGNDLIGGGGASVITNNGTIDMGKGDDSLDARGYYGGLYNKGTINTGEGNDVLFGFGKFDGIFNEGRINMGDGNDSISGNSGGDDVGNKGEIDMGAGNDVISSVRSGEGGSIKLGTGDDKISLVFFKNQIIDGGEGFDKAYIYWDLQEEVKVTTISDNSLVIKTSDGEGTFTDIELFEFDEVSFSFDELSRWDKLSALSKLDFDEGDLAAGTIVTDQFEGISISTASDLGVMIFDTGNPTGEDFDLATTDIGNVLIISEDGDSNDPDDNAAGGIISIDFDNLATVTKIGLLDIEEPGSSISIFDNDSSLIEVIEIEGLGDGSLQEITPHSRGIARIDIELAGSGALTELNFFEHIYDSGIGDTHF